MNRDYGKWFSPSLDREMEFLWFGYWGRPLLVFPTSMGRFYQSDDFGVIASLQDKIEAGEIQLPCVDSVDGESWYNDAAHPASRVLRHVQYDRYLHDEMIPYIQSRARRGDLAVFGPSFGAYHAANVAARYPDLVCKAILFSGIYDIHRFLDGHWDDRCYFHCPTSYIPNMDEDWIHRLSQVEWIIATGEFDSLVENNRQFSSLLWSKGLRNHTEIWPGVFGHDWHWWRDNLGRFLP